MVHQYFKSGFLAVALLAVVSMAGVAHAADYIIDKKGQHAFITFRVSHLGYSFIVGEFRDFRGSFSYDSDDVEASKVKVFIKAKSLDTNHKARDKHLRGEEFFDVSEFRTITFKSTSFDGSKLKGYITIRGVKRRITIDVTKIGEGKDKWGGYRAGFVGKTTLDPSKFGMPSWVGQVEVTLDVEGVRR